MRRIIYSFAAAIALVFFAGECRAEQGSQSLTSYSTTEVERAALATKEVHTPRDVRLWIDVHVYPLYAEFYRPLKVGTWDTINDVTVRDFCSTSLREEWYVVAKNIQTLIGLMEPMPEDGTSYNKKVVIIKLVKMQGVAEYQTTLGERARCSIKQ